MNIHTSESLKAQDGKFENFHYQLTDGERYQLTEAERRWLDHIRGKYCIADHIYQNSTEIDGNLVYTIDIVGLSEALELDTIPHKAVMLSDDTALQSIFFYSSIND
jgi:hypothetical protein